MAIPERPSPTKTDTPLTRSSGVGSGQHQGLHRTCDDQRVEQALDDVGLEDQGDVLDDQLRDRRSRGAPPQVHSGEDVEEAPGAPG